MSWHGAGTSSDDLQAEFVAARAPLVQLTAETQELIEHRPVPQTWEEMLADNLEAPWELPPSADPNPEHFAQWRRWIGEPRRGRRDRPLQ